MTRLFLCIIGMLVSWTLPFGSLVACVVSWQAHHSIARMLIHGFFGWFYVLYYAAV